MGDTDMIIRVYGKVDNKQRICAVDSSIFLTATEGWQEIDHSGSGSRSSRDAYALAQGNYFPNGLWNWDGTHKYIYRPGENPPYREATPEEQAAELAEITGSRPVPEPSTEDTVRLLRAQLQASTERQDFLEDCIAEMAAQVYSV